MAHNNINRPGRNPNKEPEEFDKWYRTCADAITLLKGFASEKYNTKASASDIATEYRLEHPDRIVQNKGDGKGWVWANFVRNVNGLRNAFVRWEKSGKGKLFYFK